MKYRVGVIEVYETHCARSFPSNRFQALHGVDHRWVRNDPEITTRKFTAIVKRPIEISDINLAHQTGKEIRSEIRGVPAIDIREKKYARSRPADLERHGVEELVPMWDGDRLHENIGSEFETHSRLEDPKLDLIQFNQLSPGLI